MIPIDSGGNYRWYRDLCRMGVLGEPDAELEDLLAARSRCATTFSKVRAGAAGAPDMIARCRGVLETVEDSPPTFFAWHGLISHGRPSS